MMEKKIIISDMRRGYVMVVCRVSSFKFCLGRYCILKCWVLYFYVIVVLLNFEVWLVGLNKGIVYDFEEVVVE